MSAASLKGQLGVKSGPLAPTSAKWTTQMLVISHMENHYKKINKARSAIDNKPPKSMVSGQKMRDRRSRTQIERYGSRPSSRPSSRMTVRMDSVEDDIYDEDQWEEPEDEDARKVFDIMRTTLRGPLKAQHGIFNTTAAAGAGESSSAPGFGATTVTRPRSASLKRVADTLRGGSGSRMGQTMTRPMSARSTTSMASLTSNVSQASRTTAKQTYDGDVLDKHASSFTQPAKPFTPRTLKSNRQSSLKQFKYYTPPPPKKAAGKAKAAAATDDGDAGSSPTPLAKPRRGRGGVQDMDKTQTLTETMLMDMSLQSHDRGRAGQGGEGSGVPPLDITMDRDHLSWVQDQAARAQGSGD